MERKYLMQEVLIHKTENVSNKLRPIEDLRNAQVEQALEIMSRLGEVGIQFFYQLQAVREFFGAPEKLQTLKEDYPELAKVFEILNTLPSLQRVTWEHLDAIAKVSGLQNTYQLGITLESNSVAEPARQSNQ